MEIPEGVDPGNEIVSATITGVVKRTVRRRLGKRRKGSVEACIAGCIEGCIAGCIEGCKIGTLRLVVGATHQMVRNQLLLHKKK